VSICSNRLEPLSLSITATTWCKRGDEDEPCSVAQKIIFKFVSHTTMLRLLLSDSTKDNVAMLQQE
jgi:hypothetical protein